MGEKNFKKGLNKKDLKNRENSNNLRTTQIIYVHLKINKSRNKNIILIKENIGNNCEFFSRLYAMRVTGTIRSSQRRTC